MSKQHKPAGYLVVTALLGWLFASSVFGLNFWLALLALRYYEVIETIISYQACFVLAALFVSARTYDKALHKDK